MSTERYSLRAVAPDVYEDTLLATTCREEDASQHVRGMAPAPAGVTSVPR